MLAITLRRSDLKENDEAISFYTKEQGKVEAIARGVKKMVSKNSSSLEPFSLLEIELVQGKETVYITKAVILENFSDIKKALESLVMANFVINNLENSTKVGQKDEKIFALTYKCLKAINKKGPSKLISSLYLIQLWSELGFAPDITGCSMCKATNAEKYFFYPSQGNLVCGKCKKFEEVNSLPIGMKNLRVLQKILASAPEELGGAQIEDSDLFQIQKILKAFVEYHSGKRIVWGNGLLRKKSDKTDLRRGK